MNLTLRRIGEFIGADPNSLSDFDSVPTGYSIDSRTIQPGELFFAVKGERLDGHDFIDAAFSRGALAAVVSKQRGGTVGAADKLLLVDNTLIAMQTLAAAVRRLWGNPLIAITGSAGKTTTKEITAHLLSKRFNVLWSEGNLNNHFGLPLQLLRLKPEHEIAVFELGMSHSGEIAALAKIAKPETGVVTCVAPVHLENFASVADIAHAKYELIASLPSGGTAVLNADDPYVSHFGRDFHGKVITFGIDKPCDVRAEAVQHHGEKGSTFLLCDNGERHKVTLSLYGQHNILNAVAACATANAHGVSLEQCAASLATVKAADKRGETLHLRGVTIINDCYNSNPAALKSMIDVLHSMPAKRRILVAGEMLELGPAAKDLHRECGAYAKGRIDLLIGVRGLAQHMVQGAQEAGTQAIFRESPQQAGEILAAELHPGDVVLMKASRGVKLETALDILRQQIGTAH